jgi:thiamine-monophosphate kinase
MDEFDIIRRYFERVPADDHVRIGIGDDGAVIAPPPGLELVSVVDTLVAGVHFPAQLDASDIGYRAVAVNLSDIAAMGAQPRWMTLAITLAPACLEPGWLEAFAEGLFECAGSFDVSLVGGDTTSGPQLVASVNLIGTVAPDRALARSGAAAGDSVFVTGTPGDAAAGLSLIQSGEIDDEPAAALVRRFCRPTPRVDFGQRLAAIASAAIDISDGLLGDLQKLLDASRVGARIELRDLPLSGALQNSFDRERGIEFALCGGDDYELCFTVPPGRRPEMRALQETCGIEVAEIGIVTAQSDLLCTDGGEVVDVQHSGYTHFSNGSAQ